MISNKRSVMLLFSNKLCPYSHRVRIVLAEKGVQVDLVEVDLQNKPDELLDMNPYATVPTLLDRDLVLYESSIILEYLEERFPHPPLMPVYPVARGKSRLMMNRVDRDWYTLMREILHGSPDNAARFRRDLTESLISVAPVFESMPYFLSDEFSLVDCSVAALLWRLPMLGIELPAGPGKSIFEYMDRVFSREAFQKSLTDAEREIRETEDL